MGLTIGEVWLSSEVILSLNNLMDMGHSNNISWSITLTMRYITLKVVKGHKRYTNSIPSVCEGQYGINPKA